MSIPKYLYIDDENGASEISTLHGFNDLKKIEVERFPLSEFKEFGKLKAEIIARSKQKLFDGLIVDLRLDGNGEDRTDFNATSLTQELRSIAARNEVATFPIVLCSTEEKIRSTYNSDKTSHDLFDYKISKSNANLNWHKLSSKLHALAKGYNWLNSEKPSFDRIFGLTNWDFLDKRIIDKCDSFVALYDYSHFIIKNFFHQTNPLINEKILAARLGIDILETPTDDWVALLDRFFGDAHYEGLFSDGWNRWWADKIVDVFFQISGQKLAFLRATDRVKILTDVSGISTLVSAKPLQFCSSEEFWTICEGYKVPIDPLEAFKISTSADLKPWQESKYISLLAILEREGFSDRGLRPHPSENERIEYTKELFGV